MKSFGHLVVGLLYTFVVPIAFLPFEDTVIINILLLIWGAGFVWFSFIGLNPQFSHNIIHGRLQRVFLIDALISQSFVKREQQLLQAVAEKGPRSFAAFRLRTLYWVIPLVYFIYALVLFFWLGRGIVLTIGRLLNKSSSPPPPPIED